MNMKFLSNFVWLGCLRPFDIAAGSQKTALDIVPLESVPSSLSWGRVIVSVDSALSGWNFLAWIWARLDDLAEAQLVEGYI